MRHLALVLVALTLPAPAVELTPNGFTMNAEEIAVCQDENGCVLVSRMRIQKLVEMRAAEMNHENRDRAECWRQKT